MENMGREGKNVVGRFCNPLDWWQQQQKITVDRLGCSRQRIHRFTDTESGATQFVDNCEERGKKSYSLGFLTY